MDYITSIGNSLILQTSCDIFFIEHMNKAHKIFCCLFTFSCCFSRKILGQKNPIVKMHTRDCTVVLASLLLLLSLASAAPITDDVTTLTPDLSTPVSDLKTKTPARGNLRAPAPEPSNFPGHRYNWGG